MKTGSGLQADPVRRLSLQVERVSAICGKFGILLSNEAAPPHQAGLGWRALYELSGPSGFG
jgi:hypothetical protein